MSLTFDSTTRDIACIKAFGSAYASCTANQKLLVDNNGSGGGEGAAALTELQQLAQWFTQAGIDTSSHAMADTFKPYLISLAVCRLVASERPERLPIFERERDSAFQMVVNAYARAAINTATSQTDAFSVQSIRSYVIDHCIRMSPRVFPAISTIDSQLQDVINRVFYKRWNFRRTSCQAAIATDESVTWDATTLAGRSFDCLASTRMYYTDRQDFWVDSVNAESIERLRAIPSASAPAGRPTVFHVQKGASGTTFLFYPIPDQSYTVQASINVAAPSVASDATSTSLLSAFPAPFRTIIRDLTLGRVLKMHQIDRGDEVWKDAMNTLEAIAPQYDDRGSPVEAQEVRDVNNDVWAIGGMGMLGGQVGPFYP